METINTDWMKKKSSDKKLTIQSVVSSFPLKAQKVFIDLQGVMRGVMRVEPDSFTSILPNEDIIACYLSKRDFEQQILKCEILTQQWFISVEITPKKIEVKRKKINIEQIVQIEVVYQMTEHLITKTKGHLEIELVKIKFSDDLNELSLPMPIKEETENHWQLVQELNKLL